MGSNLGTRPEPRYTRHVRGLPLQEIFAMGEAVERLGRDPGWDHIARLLEAEVAEIDRYLDVRLEPLSQAEYAMAHGRRSGLRGSQEALEAILGVYRDKLDEQRRKHEGGAESPQEAVA